MGGQLADFIPPPGIEPDVVPSFGNPFRSGSQPRNGFDYMQHGNEDKPQAEQNTYPKQHGKKDPQLPKLHLGIRTHKQGIGLAVDMHR
ncbi:hypothetical protein D3C75_1195580 [compost metagenome]